MSHIYHLLNTGLCAFRPIESFAVKRSFGVYVEESNVFNMKKYVVTVIYESHGEHSLPWLTSSEFAVLVGTDRWLTWI